LPYWGELLAAALNRPLTYRQGSDIGAAIGAARLARLALGQEQPEEVCVAPSIVRVVKPEPALAELIAARRRIFVQLYQDLKKTFTEYAA
jgi:xylulokinase